MVNSHFIVIWQIILLMQYCSVFKRIKEVNLFTTHYRFSSKDTLQKGKRHRCKYNKCWAYLALWSMGENNFPNLPCQLEFSEDLPCPFYWGEYTIFWLDQCLQNNARKPKKGRCPIPPNPHNPPNPAPPHTHIFMALFYTMAVQKGCVIKQPAPFQDKIISKV